MNIEFRFPSKLMGIFVSALTVFPSTQADTGSPPRKPATPIIELLETYQKPKEDTGILIDNNDWINANPNNITFGNHDSDDQFSPSQPNDDDSIKVVLRKGSHDGGSLRYLLPKGTQEAWISMCMRFGPNFVTSTPGKFPGFAGDFSEENGGLGGSPATGNNAWSARGAYGWYEKETDAVTLGSYIYHSAQSRQSNYGDTDWWSGFGPSYSTGDAVRLKRNRWYEVKQHIRMNTKGQENGLLEAWVNGEQVYRKSSIHFTDNDRFREVYQIWMNIYHGGGTTSPVDQYVYFDQVNYSVSTDKTGSNCQN